MLLTINIDLHDALACEQWSDDMAFEAIKTIDISRQDYGFTENLVKYLIAELIKETEAGEENFDINKLLPENYKVDR